MDIGNVPGEIGILPEYLGVTGTPQGLNGPYGKGEKGPKRWPHYSSWTSPNWTREGGAPFLPSPFPFPFLPSYSYYLEGLLVLLGKGGILLPVGVGLP